MTYIFCPSARAPAVDVFPLKIISVATEPKILLFVITDVVESLGYSVINPDTISVKVLSTFDFILNLIRLGPEFTIISLENVNVNAVLLAILQPFPKVTTTVTV